MVVVEQTTRLFHTLAGAYLPTVDQTGDFGAIDHLNQIGAGALDQ